MAVVHTRDEFDLLEAVLSGKSEADWNEFYSRYERLIIGCVRKVLARYGVPCGREDLEDLTNTVCLQLVRDGYQKLRQYDPARGYRLSSWIGLIATNAAHDALRRRGPPTYSMDDDGIALFERPAEQPSPAELAMRREQEQVLNRAAMRLSPAEQLFLRYYYQEERSPEEIAQLLGISINTVYSRKNKVRANLKRVVESLRIE